jgi:hypothetical protein
VPDADISSAVPKDALWVKLHYEIHPRKPGADLIARVWSGELDDAVVIRGASGDVFVKLRVPQKVSYQAPVTVELKLKVVAYKAPSPDDDDESDEPPVG